MTSACRCSWSTLRTELTVETRIILRARMIAILQSNDHDHNHFYLSQRLICLTSYYLVKVSAVDHYTLVCSSFVFNRLKHKAYVIVVMFVVYVYII